MMQGSDIRVCFRPEIEWTSQEGGQRWVARDPLSGRYFYFSSLETAAARLMDGRRALVQIAAELSRLYPLEMPGVNWLQMLASKFASSQLLVPASAGAVQSLVQAQQRARSSWRWLASPLSIRLPLMNPDSYLQSMRPLSVLLFNRFSIAGVSLVACVLGLLVAIKLIGETSVLSFDLAAIQGDRWFGMLACWVLIKSCHELGHGLACVYLRVRCSELGVLLLMFTPSLYCDTTDAWRLSSRWQRAAIAAAGMYVEAILATLAAMAWLITSQTSALHAIAANVMIICSVSTILINGNPLLRYDGYYILSDLWRVPNLSLQAQEASKQLLRDWLTGSFLPGQVTEPPVGRSTATWMLDRPVWLLAAYHWLSWFYRMWLLVMILWFAWELLVPYGLGLAFGLIFFASVGGLLLSSIHWLRQFWLELRGSSGLKFTRLVVSLAVLGLIVYWVAQVPMPVYVRARAVTDYSDKQPLFANDTATLVDSARLGTELDAGTMLVKFESPANQFERLQLLGEIAVLETKLESLTQMVTFDVSSSYEIPSQQQLLTDRRAKLQLLDEELMRFQQSTDRRGKLLLKPASLAAPLAAPTHWPWAAGPLDEMNRRCVVQRGTQVGWFSSMEHPELVALVSQPDVKQLTLQMPVDCRWDSDVSSIISGRIVRIAPDPIDALPDELAGDAEMISTRRPDGMLAPFTPHYAVTIALDHPFQIAPCKGALATVRIHVKTQPWLTTFIYNLRIVTRGSLNGG